LAASAIVALGGAVVANAGPAAVAEVARATALQSGEVINGMVPFTQPVHITVALKMRDRAGLDSFVEAAHRFNATGVASAMSSDEFITRHAPTEDQAKSVVDFLTSAGFKNIEVAPNRMIVTADGTADIAQSTFQTTLARVQAKDGRDTYANTDAVHIPAALAGTVLAVVGLQDVHRPHVMSRVLNGPQPFAVTGHFPNEFSSIYSGTGVATAAGVTVGIITQGSISQTITDLNSFTAAHGFATVTTQTVNTGGTSTDTSGLGEWNLDSQDIVGMAGGAVGKIIFYNEPTLSNAQLTANINTAVAANAAKIINVSLGECETSAQSDGSAAADDQSFATAVAQGQTFSVSTGDSGADECGNGGTTPSSPASSPSVIAAAGTTLNASTTAWTSETVWSGSGGSQSTFEPKPSWQTLWTGPRRGVADIAFDADPNSGAKVIVNGANQQIGGTSLAAPIFSGLWARVIAVKGTAVGFAGPLIYQLPASDFHDVVSGSNGISASAGYDLASGRGSIILSSAITHIGGGGGGNVAPVANFSFTTNLLVASFTDSSSDSDGTIASRSWNLGDGATSTATSPSHTYAAAGTYSVSLTVTDNGGLSNTKTSSVTVTSGGGGTPTQLLGNTGFETGTAAPWTASSGVIDNGTGEAAHAGSWKAWMNGYGSAHTDTLSQQVVIPAGKTSATLQYYLHIDTAETTTTTAYDTLKVQVLNTSGTVLTTLNTYSNLNKNTGYTVHTNSLAAYIGQTVVLKFTGVEDSSLQTSFVVDDVTLTVQ